MTVHRARVTWELGEGDFASGAYSRIHTLGFAESLSVMGSASPLVVPAPWSSASALDPEAAFTGALSACHMLWFLDLARQEGFIILAYSDEAEGILGRIGRGRMAMTEVILRPRIVWGDATAPDATRLAALHAEAHRRCFIANSVTTKVTIEG
jgi:organic hydroperoxide reductase OsmC/OhrA